MAGRRGEGATPVMPPPLTSGGTTLRFCMDCERFVSFHERVAVGVLLGWFLGWVSLGGVPVRCPCEVSSVEAFFTGNLGWRSLESPVG